MNGELARSLCSLFSFPLRETPDTSKYPGVIQKSDHQLAESDWGLSFNAQYKHLRFEFVIFACRRIDEFNQKPNRTRSSGKQDQRLLFENRKQNANKGEKPPNAQDKRKIEKQHVVEARENEHSLLVEGRELI